MKTNPEREPRLSELRELDARMKQTLASLAPEVARHGSGSIDLDGTERFILRRRLIRRLRRIKCAWADGVEASIRARRAFARRLSRWLGLGGGGV